MPPRSHDTWQELTHLLAAFEALGFALQSSLDPKARAFAEPLFAGLAPAQSAISAGPDGKWPKGLLTGVREGARDIPALLAVLPPAERSSAAAAVERAGGQWLTHLLLEVKTRIPKILARGRIRSEDEYRLVRAYIDTIEGAEPPHPHLQPLWRLLDEFSLVKP